ncbi:Ferrous iron uptake protein [Pantoea agglomerans]|uniref:Ferrous iron uptake protein n=1 Tax=Enterobacter agglomerans TaxID=549 RepID=A0A379AEJ7_ENTAG|nr:Ferrous iron uptake protein [Pantoea agglomerans]
MSPSDLSNTLSTHSLFGTLLEGVLGYQESPSVSEVTVYFAYLIPALILFFMPARSAASATV